MHINGQRRTLLRGWLHTVIGTIGPFVVALIDLPLPVKQLMVSSCATQEPRTIESTYLKSTYLNHTAGATRIMPCLSFDTPAQVSTLLVYITSIGLHMVPWTSMQGFEWALFADFMGRCTFTHVKQPVR